MFFASRYLKDARHIAKAARKLIAYRRDILPPAAVEEMETAVSELEKNLATRDRAAIEQSSARVEALFGRHMPPRPDASWRENCEVFLVAILIALAVRSYFIQPFTIPTGSMQPTLNGIIGYATAEPPPNFLVQIVHFLWFGRTYVNEVSKVDDELVDLHERKFLRIFTVTDIELQHQRFTVWMGAGTLHKHFLPGRRVFKAGEPVVRGYVNTGDHVFVDKISYNFRSPHRGEVFVFKTTDINTIEHRMNPGSPSQYYIKRLGGLPNDVLRIDPPKLYVNGEPAAERGIQRVMTAEGDYHGYSNGPGSEIEPFGPRISRPFDNLGYPDRSLRIPEKHYFALGDNSFQSSDSRDWGFVPERNLMGTGMFVYWPFTRHWGLIR